MSAGALLNATFDHLSDVLVRALTGLSIEQLRTQPAGPESNPIGWMSWHLTRGHDSRFSSLSGREHLWVAEGWHAKFGLGIEARGLSATLEEVRVFDPVDAETLLGYWSAARARSSAYLESMSDEELEKPVARPLPGYPTVKLSIARTASDTSQHIGQIAYARGLVDHHGWYGH